MSPSVSSTHLHAPFPSDRPEPFHLTWKAAAIVVLFGGSLLLLNLGGDNRKLTFHEVLFAQPAKEMVETGNWILPKFVGVPSTHKPPGTHWAIAALMTLTGSEAEGVVRLPTVLAAILTALIVAAMAARWFGSHVGLVAGLMQLTIYYVLQLSRQAVSDMLLIAAVTGAMACFALTHVESPRGRVQARWVPWLFYAAAALAYLFKGLIGPAFIFSGCVLFLLVSRDLRGLKFFLDPLGVAIFLFCVVGWFTAAYAQYPPILDAHLMHQFGRFEGEMGGHKPPLFYAYSILLITLPWAPFIVAGIVHGVRKGMHAEPLWRFAACWVIPGMVLLSLSAFKSKHYAAPLMPPLTIIAALSLLGYLRYRHGSGARAHLAEAALIAGSVVSGLIAVRIFQPRGADTISVLTLVLGAGLLLATWFEYRRQMTQALVTIFATTWLTISGALSLVMPHHDSYREQTLMAERINQAVPAGHKLYLLQMLPNGENQITYYLKPPLKRVDEPADFAGVLAAEGNELYVLAPQLASVHLSHLGTVDVLDSCPACRKQKETDRLTLFKLSRPTALSLTERME